MKKSSVIWIICIAVIAIIGLAIANGYNKLVVAEESVNADWANVESNYQRRADLIPNLVSTVKGYAAHEENTLTAVVDARAKATQTTIDAKDLTAENFQSYIDAQNQVSGAIGRLLMIAESYPDLKANQNFLDLQQQLEGTENRIQVARNTYNRTAQTYNQMTRRFPLNIIANMFDFEKKPYFESDNGTEKAPEVVF